MSTSLKITVEQFEAMVERGDFEPIEEHHIELIRARSSPGSRRSEDSDEPSPCQRLERVARVELRGLVNATRTRGFSNLVADSMARQRTTPRSGLADPQGLFQVHPSPDEVLLLIEVSDSTLRKDQGAKLELYAEAGIRDYWIVNIQTRCIEVYRDPEGLIFRSIETYTVGQEIHPLSFLKSRSPSLAVPRMTSLMDARWIDEHVSQNHGRAI